MKKYVLGLMFDDACSSVVLIRKDKPAWQAGLFNGVGGSIETDESPLMAMIREFKEEAGVDSTGLGWNEFSELSGSDFVVYCFRCNNTGAWRNACTVERELVSKVSIHELRHHRCVSSLTWLIHLALDANNGREFYTVAHYK